MWWLSSVELGRGKDVFMTSFIRHAVAETSTSRAPLLRLPVYFVIRQAQLPPEEPALRESALSSPNNGNVTVFAASRNILCGFFYFEIKSLSMFYLR